MTSILFSLFVFMAAAAPHPGTGSSALVSKEKGLFLISKGFRLNHNIDGWKLALQKNENEQVRYEKENSTSASLSVQIDPLPKATQIEAYSKKWMKDYYSYGFEVLGAKPFNQNGNPALVIDVIHKAKNKQLRQVIVMSGQKAAILTCSDEVKTFDKTLNDCNQVFKSFTWENPTNPQTGS